MDSQILKTSQLSAKLQKINENREFFISFFKTDNEKHKKTEPKLSFNLKYEV